MKTLFYILFIAYSSNALSLDGIQRLFIKEYPNAKGTNLDDCSTCHTPAIYGFLNPYAKALKDANYNFKNIESQDSDLDSINNMEEIIALTNPGSQVRPDGVMIYTSFFPDVHFNHKKHASSSLYKAYNVDGTCKRCHEDSRAGEKLPFKKYADDHANHGEDNNVHFRCISCHNNINTKSGNVIDLPNDCNECHQGLDPIGPINPNPNPEPRPVVITDNIAGTLKKGLCTSSSCVRNATRSYKITKENGEQCSNNINTDLTLYTFADFEVIAKSSNGRYQIRPTVLAPSWNQGSCQDDFWVMFGDEQLVSGSILVENIPRTVKQGVCDTSKCVRHSISTVAITRKDGNQCFNSGSEMYLYTFVDFEVIDHQNGRYRIRPTVLGPLWRLGDCNESYWVVFSP